MLDDRCLMRMASRPAESVKPASDSSVDAEGRQDGFQVLRLRPEHGLRATFVPAVGMTCCSLRHNGEELLGLNLGLATYAHRGTSMGISIMHPWADRLSGWTYTACGQTIHLPISPRLHTDGSGLPVNGVQSCGRDWTVAAAGGRTTNAWLDATLPFDENPRQLEIFPFPHQLHMRAEVSADVLSIATLLEATGGIPVPVCYAIRLYLRREQAPRQSTMVLPARRRLATDELALPTSATEPRPMNAFTLGADEIQELFQLQDDRRITIATDARRLTVEPLDGFALAEVRSLRSEPHVMLETLTAAPDALNRHDFPLATPEMPYQAELRLSVDSLAPPG